MKHILLLLLLTQIVFAQTPANPGKELAYDFCGFSYNNKKFKVGGPIDSWTKALGKCSRKKSFRTGYYPSINIDSLYIWDDLGITVKTAKATDWNVNEAYFFFNNLHSAKPENLLFKKLEVFNEELYKDRDINDDYFTGSSFIPAEERAANLKILKEIESNEKGFSYYYPDAIAGALFLGDVQLNSTDDIVSINNKLKAKKLNVFSYLMDNDRMNTDGLKYVTEEGYKKDPNYGATNKTINGLYNCGSSEITLFVSNSKIEFIRFGPTSCNH